MNGPNSRPRKKSLMRNLGSFFGHIAHGVTSDPHAPHPQQIPQNSAAHAHPAPAAPPPGTVRQQTMERQVHTPDGKLILRRTIIDEVHRADERP